MKTDGKTQSFVKDYLVDHLIHYGVLGMRWGKSGATTAVSVSQKGKKLKAKGGTGQPAHADAVRKATLARTKKKSGVNALSDHELQTYSNRLNLEANVKRLEYGNKNLAQRFVSGILGKNGGKGAEQAGSDARSKAVKSAVKAAAAAAA